MYTWIIFMLYMLEVNCESSESSGSYYYECGPHGRFEYCINGIPGCVVGCHCHPGYYFDTESKICEPSLKLTQNYRRQFMQEPTRLPIVAVATMASIPTPTTSNPIESRVDAIGKDTDDLGDWLYNQFFKTIENQVINSTDNDPLTRRSGNQVAKLMPKNSRRSRKKGKRKSKKKILKKKILKKKGLRRKLLRITEDDSLFDDSSSDSSSEDSSASSSSSSDTSNEDDSEHGHRKILMINKKPTPALPSFIFLPNVETPFYPPIGLPPPPVMPMYPMVPVPPVGPYISGYHQVPCNENETTSAPTTTTNGVSTTDTTTSSTSETTSSSPDPAKNPDDDPDLKPDGKPTLRARMPNTRNKKAHKANQNAERNKIIQKLLLEKMKRRNKQGPYTNFAEQDPEVAYLNDFQLPPGPMAFDSRNLFSTPPPMEDVGFKYLSQLIHKIDLNKTKPGHPFKLRQKMLDLPNRPFRRNLASDLPTYNESIHKLRSTSKADDDSYYSNLGRQIASLIRKVDSDGQSQINIEIEQQNPDPTIFNENRYAPRSYWERFVRSPLKRKQSYVDEMNHLKHSNENLFNLEDQVSMAAALERALSLHELENIANIMERAQLKSSQKSSKYVTPATSGRSYNINLLPHLNSRVNTIKNKRVEGFKPNKHIPNTINHNIYPAHKPQDGTIRKKTNETNRNLTIHMGNIKRMEYLTNIFKPPHKTPLDQQVSKIVHQNITNPNTVSTQQMMKYQLNPMMLNYKSLKYVGNRHNQYPTKHAYVPLQMSFFPKLTLSSGRNAPRPSFFDHEMHHFDFFD